MNRKIFQTLFLLIVLILLSSIAFAQEINPVVISNNQFAFDLYAQYKLRKGNIFFSPYSISSAIAMTFEGAKGKTADEIKSVLHFPEDAIIRRESFRKITNQLNAPNKEYALNTANALWAQNDYLFLDEYFSLIDRYYAGKVTNLDFVKKPEESRLTINDWVEQQTNNKIKDLIPSGIINDLTRLVLTNAIYFKGTWTEPFKSEDTKNQDFKINSTNTIKVPMMSIRGKQFAYAETEKLQILRLPYKGGELAMVILLPKDTSLDALEEELSAQILSQWLSLQWTPVDLFIPKFKFETKYFMKEDLITMGMPTAFSMGANFSGMTGREDLYLSQVIHQAFVDVNEEGTEAAAATAAVMNLKSAPMRPIEPKIFNADHPFIFIIQEIETGNILFLGRMSDPTR